MYELSHWDYLNPETLCIFFSFTPDYRMKHIFLLLYKLGIIFFTFPLLKRSSFYVLLQYEFNISSVVHIYFGASG